ncbi:HAD family hydrolase [Clostridium thermarum]|uniref:HAD family hydrolase n=1 Tax=Clostridium thermarum TaxID=1716543 RepID=UPI001120130A|nr:HAD family hydrolase [Clostridium thermarum]
MNTILFDLDGTLLPMDMKLFEKIYFSELCSFFKDILPPEKLTEYVWKSTAAMVKNTELKTNEEVFFEDFTKNVGENIESFLERFNSFYDTNFQKVKESVKDVPAIRESVRILKSKGYDMVIATNPLFPRKAIYHRIRWAGFEPEEFIYVSSFEQNHYCKPQVYYYREVLEQIDKKPEECLMVGNDVQEDLIASKLGIKTYLITNNLLHRCDEEIQSDFMGDYDDFLNFVKELPNIK